jgi:uncharacterized protein
MRWLPDGFDQVSAQKFRRPFHTFLIKIASRCNLNCSYCYVYQSPDTSWEWKPKFLSPDMAEQIAARIQEHVTEHGLTDVTIIFHGGEPLLAGLERLRELVAIFSSVIACPIQWAMQTNGTLLDDPLVGFLFEHSFRIGMSLDGTREHNDRHRLYHGGISSYDDTVRAIKLLKSYPNWKRIFGGILFVIDIRNRPADVLGAMADLDLHGANLLLPDAHYESPPPHAGAASLVYGKWLCEFFDIWYRLYPHLVVPYFEQIIALMLGGVSTAEEIGALSVDLIVVDTNGDMEAVDTLKIVGRDATALGMNVASHSFTKALSHPAIFSRMSGFDALCKACRDCEHLQNCGGGYIPHRFSIENGFINPSVYCDDLKFLFSHIQRALFDNSELGNRSARLSQPATGIL